MQCFVAKEVSLLLVFRLVFHVVVCCQQETTCTTSRVAHGFTNLWIHAINHCLNEWARCEILTCTALFILTVLFKNTFVNCTFYIAIHDEPLLFINHGDDLFQIDRLINLILSFGIDGTDKVVLLTEKFKSCLILFYQFHSIKTIKVCPLVAYRNCRFFSKEFGILCIHLQK